MIHEAYMPVYMGSRFLARAGPPEVVQEALADLKMETTGFNFINHALKRIKASCKSLLYFIFMLKPLTTFDIKACIV